MKVAHVKLCHSRLFLAIAYPRESQEMLFDAHAWAFRFFSGVPRRGIYDNMKPAVDLVFVGRERRFNRRFEQMASHYLVEPTACTPAAGFDGLLKPGGTTVPTPLNPRPRQTGWAARDPRAGNSRVAGELAETLQLTPREGGITLGPRNFPGDFS